jgi:hypothetical protein
MRKPDIEIEEEKKEIQKLEKEKLVSEIKILKNIWRHPTFWASLFTFLIAFFATIYSWKSGLFEIKSEKLELETMKLEMKRDTLNKRIDNLESKYVHLRKKYDSVTIVINGYVSQYDSIQKVLTKWGKIKQNKSDLKEEVLQFVSQVRMLINNIKISENKEIEEWRKNKNTPYANNQYIFINEYDTKYKVKAIIYREKLMKYLPNIKMEQIDVSFYEHVVNRLQLEMITDNLEYLALKLEDK